MERTEVLFFGVFILIMHLLSHYLNVFIPCAVQNLFKNENSPIWISYAVFLVIIYLMISEFIYGENSTREHLEYTFGIFFIYIMMVHMAPGPFFLSLIAVLALYKLDKYFKKEEEEKKIDEQTLQWREKLITYTRYAVYSFIILGFLSYLGMKSREYGRAFSWGRFFGPAGTKCRGTITHFSIGAIGDGIKRLVQL